MDGSMDIPRVAGRFSRVSSFFLCFFFVMSYECTLAMASSFSAEMERIGFRVWNGGSNVFISITIHPYKMSMLEETTLI